MIKPDVRKRNQSVKGNLDKGKNTTYMHRYKVNPVILYIYDNMVGIIDMRIWAIKQIKTAIYCNQPIELLQLWNPNSSHS